jgi:2-amino-4-hydroxy-6-hydroxymethyldihydropteridine diphosphokinase
MEVGLSLGSNLGDRLQNLREAKALIIALKGVSFAAQSPVYETEPVDVSPEDRDALFLNAALIVNVLICVPEMLAGFKRIEMELGRPAATRPNAPRPIDIDIIYAGDLRINQSGIIVPHPRWSARRFVVQPLSDVRPDTIVPGQNGTVAEILRGLADEHGIKKFTEEW